MNCALCFIPAEKEQARRWFDWCAELGGVSAHSLHVMPFKGLPFDFSTIKGWRSATHIPDEIGAVSDWSGDAPQRDARGPNESWRGIARWFAENKRGPWCFIEIDCIPLSPDWLDRIEAEYLASGKRYMGARVDLPPIPPHMTGNGVYPQDVGHTSLKFMLARSTVIEGRAYEVAFDVAGADDSLAHFHDTKLIIHRFRQPPLSRAEFDALDSRAVLYHSDKTGSVIPFIREKLSGRTGGEGEPRTAVCVLSAHATPTGKPKVFTYWQKADGPLLEEQGRLLTLWEKTWRAAGFDPVILDEATAKQHPRFDEWSAALLAKPTVNPPEYERACWLRWIAMAAQPERGLCLQLLDYDVMPNGPQGIAMARSDPNHAKSPWLLCMNVPCVVIGTPEHYENAIAAFITCEPVIEKGQPHLSDMHACKKLHFPSVDLCREYGTPGFEQAKLIHFSHATRHGKLRSELIEEWLAGKVNKALLDTAATMGDVTFPLRYGMHTCFRGMTADEIVDGLHQAPDPPTTRISKVRAHISALAELADTPSRKILLMKELRKQGLIGKPKKRKRRKWKMLG